MICLVPALRVPSCKHHTIHTEFSLAYLDQSDSSKSLKISVILALVQSCGANTLLTRKLYQHGYYLLGGLSENTQSSQRVKAMSSVPW